MNKEPAKCHCCGKDFESSGKYRYQVLKRHLNDVHGITMEQNEKYHQTAQTIINNTYNGTVNNITINVNIDGTIASLEDVEKLLTEKIRIELEKLMGADDSLVVKVFDVLHCNPKHPETHIANIPNKKKDEMIVVQDDGKVDVVAKDQGAMLVLEKIKKDSVLMDEATDSFKNLICSIEREEKDKAVSDIIDHLENLPRDEKKSMEDTLRKKRRKQVLG